MDEKLYHKIKDSLRDYVKPEDLEDITGWMYYEVAKHIMTHRQRRNGFWVAIGFVLGLLFLQWVR